MRAASGRTNYRYVNQERGFVHDKLSDNKVAKERLNAVECRIWSSCRNKTALMGYEWL